VVKKGTNAIKEQVKSVERKTFGCVIDLDRRVDKDAKLGTKEHDVYAERSKSNQYEVILLDCCKGVPKSRQSYPAYWLKYEYADAAVDVEKDIYKAIQTGIAAGVTKEALSMMIVQKYDQLANTDGDEEMADISTPSPTLQEAASLQAQASSRFPPALPYAAESAANRSPPPPTPRTQDASSPINSTTSTVMSPSSPSDGEVLQVRFRVKLFPVQL